MINDKDMTRHFNQLDNMPVSIKRQIAEMVICGLVGVIAFWLYEAARSAV